MLIKVFTICQNSLTKGPCYLNKMKGISGVKLNVVVMESFHVTDRKLKYLNYKMTVD